MRAFQFIFEKLEKLYMYVHIHTYVFFHKQSNLRKNMHIFLCMYVLTYSFIVYVCMYIHEISKNSSPMLNISYFGSLTFLLFFFSLNLLLSKFLIFLLFYFYFPFGVSFKFVRFEMCCFRKNSKWILSKKISYRYIHTYVYMHMYMYVWLLYYRNLYMLESLYRKYTCVVLYKYKHMHILVCT